MCLVALFIITVSYFLVVTEATPLLCPLYSIVCAPQLSGSKMISVVVFCALSNMSTFATFLQATLYLWLFFALSHDLQRVGAQELK